MGFGRPTYNYVRIRILTKQADVMTKPESESVHVTQDYQ